MTVFILSQCICLTFDPVCLENVSEYFFDGITGLPETQMLQAAGLAAAEAIAAIVISNIVGSLTAKKSGRKAYGK